MDHLSLRLDKQDPYVSLHFIMIFVRDQERSLRFYLDQLGFRLIVDQGVAGHRWIEVAPPDGSANLALVQAQAESSRDSRIRMETRLAWPASIAHHVGGDYYDFLDPGQRRLALVMGDIAGKGTLPRC